MEHASLTDEPDTGAEVIAAPEPSPLDLALRNSRPARSEQTSQWLSGDAVVNSVPIAYDPGNVLKAPLYSDEHASAVEPAVQALTALQAAAQAVLDVRAASKSDPTLTEAAAILTVANAADKLMPAATKRLDSALSNVQAQIKATEAALAAPVTHGATGPIAAELRAVVRGMDQGKRMSMLTQAIAEGDAVLAGAVLGAHPLLTGLDAAGVQALTAQWHRARNPQAVAKLALLNHTADTLHRAGQAYVTGMEELQGVRSATVQRLRAATGKAQKVIGALIPRS